MKRFFLILLVFSIHFNGFSQDNQMKDQISGQESRTSVRRAGQDTTRYIYIGAEACAGKCHNNVELGFQYDNWKNSRHSKSYESLSTEKALVYCKEAGITEKPWETLTCLKCHITAAGYDLSSIGPTYKKEDGVTCESCHKAEFIHKTFLPKEADCLICHNNSVHEGSPFDFNERCLKISHPRPKTKQGTIKK
jgi:hypothetical protein